MTRQFGWLVAVVALSASGCAAISAQRAHDRIIETEVGGYRYAQPVEVVWPQVQRLLADHQLKLAGKDAVATGQSISTLEQLISAAKETDELPRGGLMLETAWTNGGWRWRAEARPDAGGCRVVLTKIAVSTADHGRDGWAVRDLELELALMRRIDPETAARIDDLLDPAAKAQEPRLPATFPP